MHWRRKTGWHFGKRTTGVKKTARPELVEGNERFNFMIGFRSQALRETSGPASTGSARTVAEILLQCFQ